MKNNEMKNLVCDAISHAKINEQIWIEEKNNKDFEPAIKIYQNGFIVSMWHTAAAPQHYWMKTVLKKGYDELGEFIAGERYQTLQSATKEDYDLMADVVISTLKQPKE